MLVVGAALEQAAVLLGGSEAPSALDYAAGFGRLVDELAAGDALAGIAAAIDLETEIYRARGLVTYVCEESLLDIISDTTERTPTFMLPPFRPSGDVTSPPSWAFAKDPTRPTREAWNAMLRRAPRGIGWTREDYVAMKGTERMIANPPALGVEDIYAYAIGSEPDPTRLAAPASALIAVAVGAAPTDTLREYLSREGARSTHPTLLAIGAGEADGAAGRARGRATVIRIPVDLPRTPMNLFVHIAAKLVFNTISTGTMGRLGRILGNWMIQVDATNKKLVDRATRIISELGGIGYEDACIELHRTLAERPTGEKLYDDSCVARTLIRLGRLAR
jgi:N-acetylmuramic acid 6-phosphate etherase